MSEELARSLRGLGVVEHGQVNLRAGEMADFYLDVKLALGSPEILNAIANEMAKQIDKVATCVAASGYGGLPLASVIAAKSERHLIMVRDNHKDHGLGKLIEGYIPGPADNVAIIDDVFTTGSSLRQTIEAIEPTGANILSCHVVVKRGDGELSVPLHPLFQANELL